MSTLKATASLRSRTALLAAGALASAALTGCGMETRTVSSGLTKNVLGANIRTGIQETFSKCYGARTIRAGATSFAAPVCGSQTSSMSGDGVLIAFGLAAQGPLPFESPIPRSLGAIDTGTLDGFPWPVQNCSVRVSGPVTLEQISLPIPTVSYTTRNNVPAIKLQYTLSRQRVANARIATSVSCPSAVSRSLVNGELNNADVPGTHAVYAEGATLSLYMKMTKDGNAVTATAEAVANIPDIDISGINWTKLNNWGISEDSITAEYERTAADLLENAFVGALGEIELWMSEELTDLIPIDHVLCSVKTVNGYPQITTDLASDRSRCLGAP